MTQGDAIDDLVDPELAERLDDLKMLSESCQKVVIHVFIRAMSIIKCVCSLRLIPFSVTFLYMFTVVV